MKILKSRGWTQKQVLEEIGFSESVAWQWKERQTPGRNSLRLMARYFSQRLDIPYSVFDDGKAMLTKDFERLLAEKKLANKKGIRYIKKVKPTSQDTPGRGERRIAKQQFTRREVLENFEKQLDHLYNRLLLRIEDTKMHQPISTPALIYILDKLLSFLSSTDFDLELLDSVSSGFEKSLRWRIDTDADSEEDQSAWGDQEEQ